VHQTGLPFVLHDAFISLEGQHGEKWLEEEGRNRLNPKISQILHSLCCTHCWVT